MTAVQTRNGRPPEIEDVTNRLLIHPAGSWLLPRLQRRRISPNTVSLAGLGCGLLAALFYLNYGDPAFAGTAFALMLAWHILDGVDGRLARLTGTASRLGKVIDGLCDYLVYIAIYVALNFAAIADYWSHFPYTPFGDHSDWLRWVASVAGACHVVQAAIYERQRERYMAWMRPGAAPGAAPSPAAERVAGWLEWPYVLIQRLAGEHRHAANLARFFALPAELQGDMRAEYRRRFAPLLRRWAMLSANYRTVGIFVACLLGSPAYYFLFEIIGFTALLIALLIAQARCDTAFGRYLDEQAARTPGPMR